MCVTEFHTAPGFFFLYLMKQQKNCDYGDEQEQPGYGGDTYPKVDQYHGEIPGMAG